MRYIGVDLAWGHRNTTAAVVLEAAERGTGASFVARADALTDNESILAFVEGYDTGQGLVIAIDAPTLVPNAAGRRPCEAELARRFRRYEAGPHPANRALLSGPDGTIRGEVLAAELEKRGIAHTPYLDTLPDPPRAAFEAFPHPSHIALFGLEKTLKYKAKPKRDKESRFAEFRRYAAFLESLANAEPSLHLPPDADFWLRRDPASLTPKVLQRHEDALDALTCAYIALYRHYWGDRRTEVIGDLTDGHVVIATVRG